MIIALLLLASYAGAQHCTCRHVVAEWTGGEGQMDDSEHGDTATTHCLLHHAWLRVELAHEGWRALRLEFPCRFAQWVGSAPEALPLGIEHPPQLAA